MTAHRVLQFLATAVLLAWLWAGGPSLAAQELVDEGSDPAIEVTPGSDARAEQERQQRLLAGVLRVAPTGIGVVENRVLVQVNEYILRLTGYEREELLGRNARMLYVSQEDYDVVGQKKYQQIAIHGTGRVETRWQRKDGAIRHVLLSSTPLDQDDLSVGVVFTALDISDRHEAEERLRESEQRFATIFARSPGPLVLSEIATGEFIDVNDAWVAMLGHPYEEYIGKTSYDLGIWADLTARERIIAILTSQGRFRDKEIRFLTRSGEERRALWSGEVVSLGGRDMLLSLINDETERLQAETVLAWRTRWFIGGMLILTVVLLGLLAWLMTSLRQRNQAVQALREGHERLLSIFNGIDEPVYIADPHSHEILFANRAIEQKFGPVTGGCCHRLLQNLPEPCSFCPNDRLFGPASQGSLVWEHCNEVNGRWYKCIDKAISWPDGRLVRYEMAIDITKQKAAESALRASEENLRATLLSIGDAVIATDAEGGITRMNPVAERLTGWLIAEAAGRPLTEVFNIVNAESRQEVESPVARVLATGEIVGLANHTMLIDRQGQEYQIADSGAPIRNAQGVTVGVVLVFRDVSGEYAMQEQLRQSQKMEAIGQLAGGVAHDFNNMLTGIMGATEMLQMRLTDDQAAGRQLQVILTSASRAAELTGKLLAFARRSPAVPVPLRLEELVQSALGLLLGGIDRRIHLETEYAAPDAWVLGDASLLENVVLNLGINAAHAMPEGGRLVLRCRSSVLTTTDCLQLGAVIEPGAYAEILVEDEGCGIAPEHLAQIYEPFFTTKPAGQGTGLGLAVAQGAVIQHRGTIAITSSVGVGTTARVLLPLTDPPGTAPLSEQSQTVLGSGCILLVDDEASVRDICGQILSQAGYRVEMAVDGQDAIERFRELGTAVDLVILDMMMPRLNGRDCFRALRALRPDLRVIISSGYSPDDAIAELRAEGLAGAIVKPYRVAQLTRLVAEVLAGRGEHSSAARAAIDPESSPD